MDVAFFRGIAIALVVLCHLKVPGFGFGFVGVDIFFVISGYVIAESMLREYEKSYVISRSRAGIDLIGFSLRRARRIMPVAYLGLIFSLIGSYLVLSKISFDRAFDEILWPMFFSANIYFARQSNDYFAPPVEQSVFMHYWSLGLEEQFYIFLPLFFTLITSIHNLRILGIKFSWIRRLILGCSIIFAISLLTFVVSYEDNSSLAYYSLNYRVWELMWGVICALLNRVVKLKYSKKIEVFILTLLPFIFWQASESQVVYPIIALVLLIGLLFLNNSLPTSSTQTLYKLKPVLFLSKVSFSMYVFHWPVIVFCQNVLPSDLWIRLPIEVALILLATLTSHFLVEMPVLRFRIPQFSIVPRRRVTRQIRVVVSCLVISGIFYVNDPSRINSLISLNFLKPKIEKFDDTYSRESKSGNASQNDIEVVPNKVSVNGDTDAQFTESTLREAVTKALLNPEKFSEATLASLSQRPNLGLLKRCNDKTCQFGYGETRIDLIGDSHMVALGSTLLNVLDLSKYTIYTHLKQGCPFSKIVLVRSPGTPSESSCLSVEANRLNFLKNNKIDILMVNESYSYPLEKSDSYSIRYAGLKDSIEFYKPYVEKIIVFSPSPMYAAWETCLSDDSIPRDCNGYLADGSNYYRALSRITEEYKQVKVVNLNSSICEKGVCPGALGQIPLTTDGNHFRQEFLTKIIPIIKEKVDKLGIAVARP